VYYSSLNTLLGNFVNNNTDHGIYFRNSSNNTITGNTVNSNKYQGIYICDSSNYNTLMDNIANSNSYNGIYIRNSSHNTLTGNTANSNTDHGVRLRVSSNNTLTNNTANLNENDGISLYDSSNNTLTGNTADSNTIYGIYITYPSNSTLNSNQACYNSEDFHIYNSPGNSGDNNTCDIAVDWDDTGTNGCTYPCSAVTTTTTTSTSTTITTIKGDDNGDGIISLPEVVEYRDQWIEGLVTHDDMLEVVDNWAEGSSAGMTIPTVSRDLPATVSAGDSFTVSLSISVNESNKPNGVIISENVPSGWNVTSSSPAHDVFNSSTGEVKWLLWPLGTPVGDIIINYTFHVPSNATSGIYVSSGTVYIRGNNASIGGDSTVTVPGCFIPSDTSCDGMVSDLEVLYYVKDWTEGIVELFDLLDTIDYWILTPITDDDLSAWGDGSSKATVTRDLPTIVYPSSTSTISLSVNINESDPPTGIIVTERIPSGWTVASSSPTYDIFDSSTGEVKWLLWSLGTPVEDIIINYTVQVPSNATGTATFTGVMRIVNSSDFISGDVNVLVGTETTTSTTTTLPNITTTTTSTTSTITPAPVTVTRVLPESVASGSQLTVTLIMNINESDVPETVGISETFPEGWEVISAEPNGSTASPGSIEWLFWDLGYEVKDWDITYILEVPTTANGTYSFSGTVNYGEDTKPIISGDSKLLVAYCPLNGDFPPCGVVTLEEVIDFITLWSQGEALLDDVIDLIMAWAST